MPTPNWLCCTLEVAPENVEIAADWLRERGAEGVQIDDTRIQISQSEDAVLLPSEQARVIGYFCDADTDLSAPNLSFEAQICVETLPTQDWATQWRENFPPLEIGRFLIVPTWEEAPESDKIALRLDPGLAFGTGQHPTTHLCLEILGERLQGKSGEKLLDVGCGSGILSLAAAKLGARVTASDLDEWCIQATNENAQGNEVEVETHLAANLGWIQAPFPFVIANLMSDLLIKLAPDLARVTQNGGVLMVSGISAPRADEVEAAIQKEGFQTLEKREREGQTQSQNDQNWREKWTAFAFKKDGG